MRARGLDHAGGRCLAVLFAAVGLGVATPLACGDLGVPAFETDDGDVLFDASSTPTPEPSDAANEAEVATAELQGLAALSSGAPVGGALVAIEVGGLNLPNPGAVGPDGGTVATLKIDPYYRIGAIADDAGRFSVAVPEGPLGVHVYADGYLCGVPDAGAVTAEAGTVTVTLPPLPAPVGGDSGQSARPVITQFTVQPTVAAPGETVTLTAIVDAVDPAHDPLSEQVLAIEPQTGWAGIFAPPTPGKPGVGYPNGVYGRLVPAPLAPGLYKFYMVAATQACVVSAPASQWLRVTASGEGGLDAPDEVEPEDGASEGGSSDGGALDSPAGE
jgi:hypothetical protein